MPGSESESAGGAVLLFSPRDLIGRNCNPGGGVGGLGTTVEKCVFTTRFLFRDTRPLQSIEFDTPSMVLIFQEFPVQTVETFGD